MGYGSYTRTEIVTELDAIEAEFKDIRVPDGATGKTRLEFSALRTELRRQRTEWRRRLNAYDRGGRSPCATRDF